MKKLLLLLVAFFLLIGGQVFGASSMVEQEYVRGGLHILQLSWTAHTDGSFTSVQTERRIDGYVVAFETDPGATAPTPDYDITITNLGGYDIAGGALADRSDTATEYVQRGIPVFGEVTLNITNNAVDTALGIVRIYYYSNRR